MPKLVADRQELLSRSGKFLAKLANRSANGLAETFSENTGAPIGEKLCHLIPNSFRTRGPHFTTEYAIARRRSVASYRFPRELAATGGFGRSRDHLATGLGDYRDERL